MPNDKLEIDGREYPMPQVGDLNMGQARVLKRYTGMTLEQLREADWSDPDIIAAFCHIAFMADNPDATFAQIEKRVDKIKLVALRGSSAEEDEPKLPPATAQNGNVADTQRSGLSSEGSSAETPERIPRPIGTPA